MKLDYLKYNHQAWNKLSEKGNRWTVPVSEQEILEAKKGALRLLLTPSRFVPESWYPPKGARVLALASGGGQQVPMLAAAGYDVVSFDNSERQLDADLKTAKSFGLHVKCIKGDMNDLSCFDKNSFDAVFNPCSTGFIPDVANVYHQVGQVLKPGGLFMTGFANPVIYLFDIFLAEKGEFKLKYSQPYSDLDSLDEAELKHFMDANEPLVFGHSLAAHFKGQIDAGLGLVDMFEDYWGEQNPLDKYLPGFIATVSRKLDKDSVLSLQ